MKEEHHGYPQSRRVPARPRREGSRLIRRSRALASVLATPSTVARIVKFEVTSKESPTFGGYSFAGVGQYEKLAAWLRRGRPERPEERPHRRHRARAAQRARHGRVLARLSILKPIDLVQGRTQGDLQAAQPRRQDDQRLNRGVGGNDPAR